MKYQKFTNQPNNYGQESNPTPYEIINEGVVLVGIIKTSALNIKVIFQVRETVRLAVISDSVNVAGGSSYLMTGKEFDFLTSTRASFDFLNLRYPTEAEFNDYEKLKTI